jgi:hypothetical protein
LHSDRQKLAAPTAESAKQAGLKVLSTAQGGKSVVVDLFPTRTFHQVGSASSTLREIALREKAILMTDGMTADDAALALSRYTHRPIEGRIQAGAVLSLPTGAWAKKSIEPEKAIRSEIEQGLKNGWSLSRNPNVSSTMLAVRRTVDHAPMYLLKPNKAGAWDIYSAGFNYGVGKPELGKWHGQMKPVKGVRAPSFQACEYCGAKAIGWCHMRNKHVCDTHRYFTEGNVRWRCP